MKAIVLLQRRHRGRAAPAISLFPFLAVLICTMGALVLLLFVVCREARLQAVREAAARTAQSSADAGAARELAEWRIEQLKQSRKATESQLADARLILGHLEDHSRQLREKLDRLQTVAADAQRSDVQRRAAAEDEVRRVEGQIAQAQRSLADSRQRAASRPRSYAVIPYDGPNQTHRRPLYLECRADSVVLQPEEVVLTTSDFEGPLGPGNPLATVLRTAREQLLNRSGFDARKDGEPYPLLLVRPDGIAAYYAVRAAMKSWGSEFGYELVGADWKLEFGNPDPQLAVLVRQELAMARARQDRLIAAAPSRYQRRPKTMYRAGSSGGIVREGPAEDDDVDDGLVFRPSQPAGAIGNRYGGSGAAGVPGGAPSGSSGVAGGSGYGGGTGDGRYAAGSGTGYGGGYAGGGGAGPGAGPSASGFAQAPGSAGGAYATGGGTGNSASGPAGGFAQSSGSAGGAYAASGGTGLGGSARSSGNVPGSYGSADGNPSNTGASGGNVTRPDGFVAGRPEVEQDPYRRPPADAIPGQPLRPGEWQPHEDRRPEPEKPKRGDREELKNLAKKRGRDWGLRDAADGSTPVTRPIRVECRADRLVLVSETGGLGREITLGPSSAGSIDRFISAVWEHMDAWGIAGKGLYWRPIIAVRVAPGGKERFEDLHALLQGSGLTVERKL